MLAIELFDSLGKKLQVVVLHEGRLRHTQNVHLFSPALAHGRCRPIVSKSNDDDCLANA
jgi:hypothetical protein